MEDIDPFEDLGIEEAEIVTVVLSEAASAKEALELLTGIYDNQGANSGSGIIIANSNEAWYIENVTGHQYIAVKLSDTLVFVEPNMVVIGAIDLDDTENVIASENLIAVAQQAGTFVGDADANVIDFVNSYNPGQNTNARMLSASEFLGVEPDYALSNVDAEGNIVPLYNGFEITEKLSIEDVQNFYHISNIGYQRNLEGHIFQITDDSQTGTVEWVCVNDNAAGVFIPYYPMLTTDVYEPYKLSTLPAEFTEEAPTEGIYYATTVNRRINGERVAVNGYMVLPEVWESSLYWTYDALSNLMLYGNLDEAVVAAAYADIYAKQAEVNAAFAALDAETVTAETATAFSAGIAQDIHEFGLAKVAELLAK